MKEVRKSIESNIKQIGTNLSADAIGRIKGDIDNGWLDDSVIDCAQNLIHSQFPNIDGLQSCCYAQKPCFRPTTDTFIQILNTHPKGGGLHWVTVLTYENPVSGAVKLYDSSLALGVSTSIEMSVSNMLRSPESSISIKLMNSDIQPNTNDCGVYAIAFAVSLAFGKEPAYLHFENSKMRSHLLNCLQSGVLTEFPCKPEKRKSLYVQAHTVPLYCTCRMPESDLMFQCTKCQRWFYPNCQEIKMNARQMKNSKTVKCLECRSK